MNRRELIGGGLAVLIGGKAVPMAAAALRAQEIQRTLRAPLFPERSIFITKFGAVADGEKFAREP